MKVRKNMIALLAVVFLGLTVLPISASAETQHAISGSVTLKVGEQKDLNQFIIHRSNSESDDYWYVIGGNQWDSSNEEVATVDSKGVVTGHRNGVVRITATGWDNVGDQHVQKVVIRVGTTASTSASTSHSFSVTEGKIIDLRALLYPDYDEDYTLKWSSSNHEIAEVDSDGRVTANSIGSCKITATYTDSNGETSSQRVSIRVSSVLLRNYSQASSITLKTGDAVDVFQVFYPNYVGKSNIVKSFKISTSDSGIVGVSGQTINAKSKGKCTVTLSDNDTFDLDESQTITVKVVDE